MSDLISTILTTANTAMSALFRLIDTANKNVLGHAANTSLTNVTKLTQVEPVTVVSLDLQNDDKLPVILNTMLTMFVSYYLQAWSLLSIRNIEVIRTLDSLNPDRDWSSMILQSRVVQGTETIVDSAADMYRFALPVRSAEAITDTKLVELNQKALQEDTNLAVGKIVNLTVDSQVGPEKKLEPRTIPINFRLFPSFLAMEPIKYLFGHRTNKTSFSEQYWSWRAGKIEMIRDVLLCGNLIKEFKRAAILDKTGTIQEIARRVRENRNIGLASKNPSLAMASTLYVLSSTTATAIEGELGLKFSSPNDREKIFNGIYAMVIAVYNPDWENVTFYFNGIAPKATFPISALKSASKSNNVDIGSMMKSLLDGRAPTF